MKLVSLLAVAIIGLFLLSPSVMLAESASPVEITSISHAKQSGEQETITFTLAASVPVKMFDLKGERPRLVIDFPGAIYKGKNMMALADGELANTIRIGLHKEPENKTRVVIDLSKGSSVHYKHRFIESEGLLEVVLTTEVETESVVAAATVEKTKEPDGNVGAAAPVQKEVSSLPLDKKPAPEELHAAQQSPGDEVKGDAAAGQPQLLEISFDDSSNRGEMVLFHLNDFFPPAVSAIEKNNPRVLCDFPNISLSSDVQKTIDAGGKYVESIRAAYHAENDNVRVVLDLSPDRDYDLQQVFFKNDNLFVLIINELHAENVAQ